MFWLIFLFLVLVFIGLMSENNTEKKKQQEKKIVDDVLKLHAEGMKNNWRKNV